MASSRWGLVKLVEVGDLGLDDDVDEDILLDDTMPESDLLEDFVEEFFPPMINGSL